MGMHELFVEEVMPKSLQLIHCGRCGYDCVCGDGVGEVV